LSLHRFTSSGFNGSSSPSLISTLLEDVMAVAWVQMDANWDGLPSSHLVPLNSSGRNAQETIFLLFLTSLNFSDQTSKSNMCVLEETGGEPPPGSPGPIGLGRPACPGPRAGSVRFFVCPTMFAFLAHVKKMAW
jgi:hypothetical protein